VTVRHDTITLAKKKLSNLIFYVWPTTIFKVKEYVVNHTHKTYESGSLQNMITLLAKAALQNSAEMEEYMIYIPL
jgi:hypothetical protein